MFGLLRPFINDLIDPELEEGFKNFLILISVVGGGAVMMAIVAHWLSHR